MTMKKLLSLVLLLACSAVSYAQNEVTQFLGIPVDGSKSEMIQKLKAKGFQYNSELDRLEGEFNGRNSHIHVVTNNNKVYRIMVTDAIGSDESDIKIRFNTLCRQFENNPKYEPMIDKDQSIPDDEDLSYEIKVNKKRYEAGFYQIPAPLDTVAIYNESKQSLLDKYTQEQLDNPTEEISAEIQLEYLINKSKYDLQNLLTMSNKLVWFMIDDILGRYNILLFYDNVYNQANGEDL